MTYRAIQFLMTAALLAAGPMSRAADTPLLDQLNRETQTAYREVRAGLVLVQMPAPAWVVALIEQENPLAKWGKEMDPAMRQHLAHEQALRAGGYRRVGGLLMQSDAPTTQPSTMHSPNHDGNAAERATFTLLGILLNDQGDVLVPLFLEKNIAAENPVRAIVGEQHVSASFLGSDKSMNLTVVRLDRKVGKPAVASSGKPREGELTLILSPEGAECEMHVWTGGKQDHGIIARLNGEISGFCRSGQFMSVATAMPIAQQIIEHGQVRRASLGVRISEVRTDDPARHTNASLGDRPAVRIEAIVVGSAAETAGLLPGDFILSLAGESVGELPTFACKLASRNGKTELKILRGSEERAIEVELIPK